MIIAWISDWVNILRLDFITGGYEYGSSYRHHAACRLERRQDWLEYARLILERTGVVHYNNDGHHFISTKYLNMLQIDAIRQLAEQMEVLQLEG